jgi:hypothetical protein
MDEQGHEQEEEGRRPVGALVGLVVIALLVLAGLWLSNRLHSSASMQDCLASGRTNCAPIETQQR